MIKLCDDIRKHANEGRLVGSIFVDLSRAFDRLSHGTIIGKLRSYGVCLTELEWFTCYLFNRRQIVVIDEKHSEKNLVTSGVPQGSNLGSLLFMVFYNDLREWITHSENLMFADDTVL